MARGWESKAVEEQQSMSQGVTPAGPSLSDAEAADQHRLASLKLARARVLADLQQACRPAHRAMLEAALRDIDTRLTNSDSAT